MIALDLFAGTGWGVACQKLGIEEHGVEIMDEAVASRDAAGMSTIFRDVWTGLEADYEDLDPTALAVLDEYNLLIASPPCQTFSVAGKGAGREALDDVLGAIRFGAYKSAEQLRAVTGHLDARTALVLTPLVYAYRDRPTYVVFEQVPAVLPVWEACAEVLREIGYSAVTAVLNAEQYGVPQTRRRAILFARLDGQEAVMPTPTHSKYYSRTPEKLDQGVEKWVSMAEALECDEGDLVGFPRRSDGREEIVLEGVAYRARDLRQASEPAQTVTEKARSWSRFTAHKNMGRGMVERYGERPGRSMDEPAFTIRASAGGTEPGGFVLRPEIDEWKWKDAPATTVAGDPRITAREHHYHGEQSKTSLKLTENEAARFQTFPADFPFAGSKTSRFLQIGNAVPPLLGEAILAPIVAAAAAAVREEAAA